VCFLGKSLLFILPPVVIFAVFFVMVDPFKVIGTYGPEDYFPNPDVYPARVGMNKGVVTLNAFNHSLERGDTCNAFIFGSSISAYYDITYWKSRLKDEGHINAMHFDSSSETLYSMRHKVEYLDSKDIPIDYALIVLDPIIMQNEDESSPFSIDPPILHTKNPLHALRFYYTFFRASTNADFFKNWIPFMIDGKYHNNGHNILFEFQPIVYDVRINQEFLPDFDHLIRDSTSTFYSKFPLVDSPDFETMAPISLSSGKLNALRKIASIFKKKSTDYRIIIGPNRRKVIINNADLDSIKSIFGKCNVFDFSSSLSYRLETDTLLYDNTHYRPVFASELMDSVYGIH